MASLTICILFFQCASSDISKHKIRYLCTVSFIEIHVPKN